MSDVFVYSFIRLFITQVFGTIGWVHCGNLDKFILQVIILSIVKCFMVELEVLATYTPLRNVCICEINPYKYEMSLPKHQNHKSIVNEEH